MLHTPLFPQWRPTLGPLGPRCRTVRAYTLSRLEDCFGARVPAELFPKAPDKANSRDRDYTRWRTFWLMIWQGFNPKASGREVVRQFQALLGLAGGPTISASDGAYCRARQRLPLDQFPKALAATAQAADGRVASTTQLQGRPLKVIDGAALTLADTPKNRAAYPPIQCRPGQSSFPMLRLVVLFSLLSGAILTVAQGSLVVSELALFNLLRAQLTAQDILLGDRGFGCYAVIALLKQLASVDFSGRTNRQMDGRRRRQRLAPNDWLFEWQKPLRPAPWMSALLWLGLPGTLAVRVVKGSLHQRGFRVRQVTVVTTLLDPQLYPAQQILAAYLRRWRLEMCLDDLKTTLKIETLRGHSPASVQKELLAHLIGHNLIRDTMAQAASHGRVALEHLSFKGTLDGLRQFAQASASARSAKRRRALWTLLLQALVDDLLPQRPGRREPRAVKRKKHKYPTLNAPRHKFRDHPKRHTRRKNARKNARLRDLGLM